MTEADQTDLPLAEARADPPVQPPSGWQALPKAACTLFVCSGLLLGVPFLIGGAVAGSGSLFDPQGPVLLGALSGIVGAGLGAWIGWRRYRYTSWLLDDDGFSLRKGRMWQSEIRVPMNRVQHLDLRRGPLERPLGLATLVIHTAGTRDSSVNVGGLRDEDAERLRDLLARQADHDDRTTPVPAEDADDVAMAATPD